MLPTGSNYLMLNVSDIYGQTVRPELPSRSNESYVTINRRVFRSRWAVPPSKTHL